MAKKLFGTDGIRGVAGEPPLDDDTVFAVGSALGKSLLATVDATAVIGMDTRESGPHIAALLADGLASQGVAVRSAGIITTPGVAYLTRSRSLAAGIMISASHNPFHDNGIKVFGPSGMKLPDRQEEDLETEIAFLREDGRGTKTKRLTTEEALQETYLNYLLSVAAEEPDIAVTRVIVDCANGAASQLAPKVFERLGVDAEIIGDQPNGRNINEGCGSLHLENLRQRVSESDGRVGIAFDGDADRVLFVAEDGSVVDGDAILLLAAEYLVRRDRLPGDRIVTTVMANMGLEKALGERGLSMLRTSVGDKYVLEEMLRAGAELGGEQSGHIIFRSYATTGDGLLTALMMLRILAAENKPLSELRKRLAVFPQKLENVRVTRKPPIEEVPAIADAVDRSRHELNGRGRVVVRYSGTEPLARVMVEAETQAMVDEHTRRLVELFQQELGT